ncbi:MAG: UDP-glucuronic acid decarboxylase family protein [Chloroflexota bacterium]
MRVLVTGGAGFIGSHLCDYYLNSSNQVIALDNLITGRRRNIRHLLDNPSFEFILHDITREITIDEDLDAILHFASPASPVDYLKFPIETLEVGAQGTKNALDLAREKNAVFLLASTSEVYGDPLENPQNERYWGNVNPIGRRSVYDEAKRYAEALTMAYHRHYNLDTRIIRIFNTYGPRMRMHDGRVVPNFIHQAITEQELSVFHDGAQTRSFCYVDDLVKGVDAVLQQGDHMPYNLGNPNELPIIEFAKLVLHATESKSKPQLVQPSEERIADDPRVRHPDITRARTNLGWEPQVSLEEGLAYTIAYFRENK